MESVKKGECILFLGAMASAPSPEESPYKYENAPPSGAELSKRLAKKSNYPDKDVENLQRVSLFIEYRDGGSRESLVKAIVEEITAGGFEPSPALRMLAALPFRIVITTNYDHLFDRALRDAKTADGHSKDPIIKIYDPNGPPEKVPLDPLVQRPILLKLHGDIDKPESIVVSEEDYIVFIQRMSTSHLHPIHDFIRTRMRTWQTLFIGYSLKDYNLRLLFKTLRWNEDAANFPLSYSVDPKPDNLIVSVLQTGKERIISFIKENLWSFVPALYKECVETSEKLSKLPAEVKFPESLKDKIRYDESRQLLTFKGVMAEEEKDKLLKLSQDIPYKDAIEALLRRSQVDYQP